MSGVNFAAPYAIFNCIKLFNCWKLFIIYKLQ
nr:MAG TPA: hypothetical protein [Bacteriophage sp.]